MKGAIQGVECSFPKGLAVLGFHAGERDNRNLATSDRATPPIPSKFAAIEDDGFP